MGGCTLELKIWDCRAHRVLDLGTHYCMCLGKGHVI